MHPLLARQFKRLGLDPLVGPPPADAWPSLIEHLNHICVEADQDRYTLERSLMVSSREMTELYQDLRRSAQSELAVQHESLKQALAVARATQEAGIDGILIVRSDRSVLSFNRRFVELWQIPDETLTTGDDNRLLGYVMPQLADPDAFVNRVEDLYRRPCESSRDQVDLRDGRTFDRVSAPIRSENSHYGRVWFFRDITAERRAEQQLRTLAAELERRVAERSRELEAAQARLVTSERLSAIGQLAAGVAHEINNPLAYVSANVVYAIEELERAGGPAGVPSDVVAALREAKEGGDRIRHTTRDLKLFSRGETEQRGPVDLRRLLDSCLNMAWNEIRHRARLIKDFGPTPLITANEGRLAQVFLNLLVNAAQAIPEGAANDNTIRIVTRAEVGRAVVEIHDTGAGIPPDLVTRLFEPFFTTKPIGVGTGLGLSICHGIVHGMGGSIEVDSAVGRGSVFRVLLPEGPTMPAASKTPQPELTAPFTRARVLAIDDEPMVLTSIQRALRDHEVVPLRDARGAVSLLAADSGFDVILCDLMMPNMSGMELHAEVARSAPAMLSRIVFLSGGAFTPRAQEFLEGVTNKRIEKPFDPANLRAVVGDYARRHRPLVETQ